MYYGNVLLNFLIIFKLILIFQIKNVNCQNNIINNIFNFSLVELSQNSYFINAVKLIMEQTNFTRYFDWRQTKCNSQINYIISQQLTLNDTKILAMFDAWGKFPSGILEGKLFDLGSFDECMKMKLTTEAGNIKGQYCLIKPNNPLNMLMGICVPESCESHYINELLNYLLNNSNNSTIRYVIDCQAHNPRSFDVLDITMLSILCFISVIMLISTLYDILSEYFDHRKSTLLVAFSVYTNGKRLFVTKNSSDVIKCLNGIRVLSLLWIVMGHVYAIKLLEFTINLNEMTSWLSHYYSMLISTATVAVDSFLLLSGLLVTIKVFKELERSNGKLNIIAMYFHRYIRITPANAATILFTMSLYRYLGHGPISIIIQEIGVNKPCEKYWWSALLYLQNYINPAQICLMHTWYLSMDMQLFLISPLILLPLWKYGRVVVITVLTLIIFCVMFTFHISYENGYTWNLLKDGGLLRSDQITEIYIPTHLRMGPWLVGIILGYVLSNHKSNYVKLNNWFLIFGWSCSILIILIVTFGPYNIQQLSYYEHPLESPFFISLHRVAWSVALSFIVFACATGNGSFINTFLSWGVWTPLARISYSMYLLHITIQFLRIKSIKTGSYFSDFNAIHTFWGDLGLTMTASVFWVLAFESPIIILEKIILNKRVGKLGTNFANTSQQN